LPYRFFDSIFLFLAGGACFLPRLPSQLQFFDLVGGWFIVGIPRASACPNRSRQAGRPAERQSRILRCKPDLLFGHGPLPHESVSAFSSCQPIRSRSTLLLAARPHARPARRIRFWSTGQYRRNSQFPRLSHLLEFA